MKKFVRVLVLAITFSSLGCEFNLTPREIIQDTLNTTIGFTFGRLLVSSLLSSHGN